jgi:hypothetical protein
LRFDRPFYSPSRQKPPDESPNFLTTQLRALQLPDYIAGWDVALLPFARNDATRFISPTKTSEYLAAGKPVVSTPIRDVVQPYGALGFVRIADTPPDFIAAIEATASGSPRSISPPPSSRRSLPRRPSGPSVRAPRSSAGRSRRSGG